MPSMEELMANPALRDMYVDSLEIDKICSLLPRANQFGAGR